MGKHTPMSNLKQLKAEFARLHENNPNIVPETPDQKFGNKSYSATWDKACKHYELLTKEKWPIDFGQSWPREESNKDEIAVDTSSEASSERTNCNLFPQFLFDMLYTFSTIQ